MNTQDTVAELERLAEAVGVKVSYEPMSGLVQGIGGLCRVRGEHRLIVDRRLQAPERLQILVEVLRKLETSEHFVSPQVRTLLEGPKGAPEGEASDAEPSDAEPEVLAS